MQINKRSLEKLLDHKKKLHFSRGGKFKILYFSDLHSHYLHMDPRTYEAMEKMIEETQPDLVYFLGDLPGGPEKRKEAAEMLSIMSRPMDKRGIPWTLVFGNHEGSICRGKTREEIGRIFERDCPGCLFKTVKGLHGVSNHVIPVYASESSDKIALTLFGLDAGSDISAMNNDCGFEGDMIEYLSKAGKLGGRDRFDIVRFDQVMWYWQVSEAIEKMNGKTPALLMTHSGYHETKILEENPVGTEVVGEFAERPRVSPLTNGLFTAALQRGDVIGMYYGHNHVCVVEGKYCGIRLGYVGSIGYDAYGTKQPHSDKERNRVRGARLITLNINDMKNYESRYLFASDFVPPIVEVK